MNARPTPAHRVARQHAIVRLLAAEPGLMRSQIAERFGMSERQIQKDLRALRGQTFRCYGIGTVDRDHGYRLSLSGVKVIGPGGPS